MKRLVSAFLIALMAFTLTIGVSAHSSGAKWGDVPKFAGTINVDGKLDDIYKQGLQVKIDRRTDGKTGGATAVAYLLYSDKYFYAFFDVTDPDICDIDKTRIEKSSWTNEGVEFTLDYKNDGTNRSKFCCYHDGTVVASGDAAEKKATCTAAGVKSATGWTVEIRCELLSSVKAGANLGIQMLVNDMTAKNATRGIIRCPSKLNCGDNDVAKFDYITLGSTEVKVPVATTAKPAATTAKAAAATATKAAQTADPITVAVLLTLASGAVVVSRKRK